MGEQGFDFVVRIVVQQRIGENDAPGCAKPGEGGVGLFTFLGKMPLVDTAHACAGAFAEDDQSALEFLVFERLEFVKNRKQHNPSKLRNNANESPKTKHHSTPPAPRSLAL